MSRYFLVILSLLALNSCGPRGESATLDQILASAKQRFSSSAKEGLDSSASQALSKLSENLNQLESGGTSSSAKTVSQLLLDLKAKAGYTSRPSIEELAAQYQKLAPQSSAASTKLLVARTYNLVASELETTRFALN